MSKILSLEDLISLQKARELVNVIYDIKKEGSVSKDIELVKQLRQTALSKKTDIGEDLSGFHKKDAIRFLGSKALK